MNIIMEVKKSKSKQKKKYTERDKRDDLERLKLLLISLEAPAKYKVVYDIININDINDKNDKNIIINENDINDDNDNKNDDDTNIVIKERVDNLVWLNHNLSILNKRNIKLIETLKLIQRILRKLP